MPDNNTKEYICTRTKPQSSMYASFRILLLSSQPQDIASQLISMLPLADFRIATNKTECIAALENTLMPVIILDESFSELTFDETVGLIKKNVPAWKLFLLINSHNENYAISKLSKGASDYFFKDRPARLFHAISVLASPDESKKDQYQEIFKTAPVCIAFTKGPHHTFTHANPLYLDLIGKKNIIGKKVKDVLPEIIAQGFIDILDSVYKTGQPFKGNEVHIKMNRQNTGELIDNYVNFIYHPSRNEAGFVDGITCFAVEVTEQVQARSRIEKSEQKYRQIVETAQEGIWVIDKDYRTTFVNDKLCDILGYTREEMLGKDIYFFMDEEYKAIARKALSLNRKGLKGQGEFKYISKQGKIIWTSISVNPLLSPQGEYLGGLAMLSDISSQKHTLFLLNKANSLARIGNWELDLINNSLYWSDITKEIHEVAPDYVPLLEKAINFYREGVSRKKISEALQLACETGQGWDLELQLVTAKNNLVWVRAIGQSEFVGNKCVKVFGSFQDIETLKRTEFAAIRRLKEKNAILESIGDGFFAMDNEWRVTYWNRHAEALLNIKREKIIGKVLWDVFPDELNGTFHKHYQEAKRTNQPVSFEALYESFDMWARVKVYPSTYGLSVYFSNITDQKNQLIQKEKITLELIQRNSDLEQFGYIISHNLRAPVANILGLSEILNSKNTPAPDKIKAEQFLFTAVSRLDGVIKDLNNILEIKRDLIHKREMVSVTELIEEIKLSIYQVIVKEKVTIILNLKVDALFILKSFLYSIFYNLISNSIKYRKPFVDPVIEISTHTEGENIIIEIKDNGRGINLEKYDNHVFGLYKRFHLDTEGKGVGLFMVKTQVQTLGGHIAVRSGENEGTQFTITFSQNRL